MRGRETAYDCVTGQSLKAFLVGDVNGAEKGKHWRETHKMTMTNKAFYSKIKISYRDLRKKQNTNLMP